MAQDAFVNRYSRADRLLHRLSFASGGLQVSLADLEDRAYKKPLAQVKVERPVFITALPRAGTTMVLNLLYETGEFVSHTYRGMPFVLCPIFWRRFSRVLRADADAGMERAHGDGIVISPDSAEAFEEIVWRQFWPDHYREDRIVPWGTQAHGEFEAFLRNHLRKLIWLRHDEHDVRYLAKNNLNIARLPYLRQLFPDAELIVPFRAPLQHAASLLKQHRAFLGVHESDRFAADYMRGIGHHDFGKALLPVDFGGWLQGDRRADATGLSFWLEYWVATYRALLPLAGETIELFGFDRWLDAPRAGLEWLARAVGAAQPGKLIARQAALHKAPAHEVDVTGVAPALIDEAQALFDELNARAGFAG